MRVIFTTEITIMARMIKMKRVTFSTPQVMQRMLAETKRVKYTTPHLRLMSLCLAACSNDVPRTHRSERTARMIIKLIKILTVKIFFLPLIYSIMHFVSVKTKLHKCRQTRQINKMRPVLHHLVQTITLTII